MIAEDLPGTFYLARHGETEANRAQIVQGSADTPLTELGRAQAAALGRRLATLGVQTLVSSDLPRAVATADIIQEYVAAPVRLVWPEARERSWGVYEMQPGIQYWQARTAFERANPGLSFTPENGEPLAKVLERASIVLARARDQLRSGSVAVVAHGAFNREFLRHLLHPNITTAPRYEQDSACLNIVTFGSGDFALHVRKINCTEHYRDIR